jgi:bifunctional pyridoxal-dependent enzyme with beta-cystathionase and maltose regulon repressor activities
MQPNQLLFFASQGLGGLLPWTSLVEIETVHSIMYGICNAIDDINETSDRWVVDFPMHDSWLSLIHDGDVRLLNSFRQGMGAKS